MVRSGIDGHVSAIAGGLHGVGLHAPPTSNPCPPRVTCGVTHAAWIVTHDQLGVSWGHLGVICGRTSVSWGQLADS